MGGSVDRRAVLRKSVIPNSGKLVKSDFGVNLEL